MGNPDKLEDVKNFLEIFDDAYFGGLLKGFVKLEMIPRTCIVRREGVEIRRDVSPLLPRARSRFKHRCLRKGA